MTKELFKIPILDRYLLYVPLYRFAALVDQTTIDILYQQMQNRQDGSGELFIGGNSIFSREEIKPLSPSEDFRINPQFLGLVTTRGCNMGCKYCDFREPNMDQKFMSPELVRDCIDEYLDLLVKNNSSVADTQFFGGEPFLNSKLVVFAVDYAREKAREKGIIARFEVTTNGYVTEQVAKWIATSFDEVMLSLDGPEDIQNLHRPLKNDAPSFPIVYRTAQIISQGSCELVVRSCVSAQSVERVPEIASWVAENFITSKVCFEALTPSPLSKLNHLEPPDPYQFGIAVLQATRILEEYGIDTITSGTDIEQIQTSYCPVGKDALIIDPHGKIAACYLLEEDWKREGLDLVFGQYNKDSDGMGKLVINKTALQEIRSLAQIKGNLCTNCFCKYHCAGGCHVNHKDILIGESYDDVCLQTRLIVAGKILQQIGAGNLFENWLGQIEEVKTSINSMGNLLLF